MTAPFEVGGTEVYLSVSIGHQPVPAGRGGRGRPAAQRGGAMYESKKAGPAGYVVSSHGAFDSAPSCSS